jgi:serine/threonine protein phosphatase PrpC
MENLLNDLLAKETSMGIGCDNMTAILVRFHQWS